MLFKISEDITNSDNINSNNYSNNNINSYSYFKNFNNDSEYLFFKNITTTVSPNDTPVFVMLSPTIKSLIILICYVIGIAGNLLALVFLNKNRFKSNKYTLMLRFLAFNNLVGLLGMLIQFVMVMLLPISTKSLSHRFLCIGRVIFRFFGLSSGCIAAVMAAERWLSLAKPFVYQKYVTFKLLNRIILGLCFTAGIITFLPLFGFGIYYDEIQNKCIRYRYATELKDIIYAYLFLIFGLCLCGSIVIWNFFVIRVLYYISKRTKFGTTQNFDNNNIMIVSNRKSISIPVADELRFAKMMAFLSISFVVCWMPQMITIIWSQSPKKIDPDHWFSRLADILMAIHFTLDPYIYVLLRRRRTSNQSIANTNNYMRLKKVTKNSKTSNTIIPLENILTNNNNNNSNNKDNINIIINNNNNDNNNNVNYCN